MTSTTFKFSGGIFICTDENQTNGRTGVRTSHRKSVHSFVKGQFSALKMCIEESHTVQAILITNLIQFSILQFERIPCNITISPNTLLNKESRFQNSVLVFTKSYGTIYIERQRLSLRVEIIFQFFLIWCPNEGENTHGAYMQFMSSSVLLFIRDLGGLVPGPFV